MNDLHHPLVQTPVRNLDVSLALPLRLRTVPSAHVFVGFGRRVVDDGLQAGEPFVQGGVGLLAPGGEETTDMKTSVRLFPTFMIKTAYVINSG